MSSETISSVFPDRLIHPLPKRRLRERLSPDVAGSIQYPPSHVAVSPLFYYPYNLKDDVAAISASERAALFGRNRATTAPSVIAARQDVPGSLPARRSSTNGEASSSSRIVRLVNRSSRHPSSGLAPSSGNHQAASSAVSSMDGYDSFENTNNKKKRKIPTAGDASHAGNYTTEIHVVPPGASKAVGGASGLNGVSSPSSTHHANPSAFVAAASGISGPGRGRYGRSRNEPSDKLIASSGNGGIISNAIANAANAKQASHAGKENAGGLGPGPSSVMSTPASSQFTFTCSSQVPGHLTWPGSDGSMPDGSSHWQQGRLRGGYGLQQSTGGHDKSRNGTDEADGSSGSIRGSETGDAKQSEKAATRKLNRELQKQARDRKRSQERLNRNGLPAEELYMCPFCEYETFYRKKPWSIIRSFELKERKKREQAEERQRLLDKAKARSRKGKKASRAATANKTQGNATENQAHNGRVDNGKHENIPPGEGYDEEGEEEEEMEEEGSEDDVYDADPEPMMGPQPSVEATVKPPPGVGDPGTGHPSSGYRFPFIGAAKMLGWHSTEPQAASL